MFIESIRAAEMDYRKHDSVALRKNLILKRDAALAAPQPDTALVVVLSHTIAWMAAAMEELYA